MSDPFSIGNVFDTSDVFGNSSDPFTGKKKKRVIPEYRQPLDDSGSESFGKKVLNTGLSGLSYISSSLDKPGEAVRGLLAGKGAASLKHLVPFSGAMGLTNDEDSTSGRDLTDKYGITDKHSKGWGSWGAGLAADIVTNPTTYMTFGTSAALNPAGKALSKAGALKGWSRQHLLQGFHNTESALTSAGRSAPEIAHMVDQGRRIATPAMEALGAEAGKPLSGLAKVGIPFGPSITLGTGKRSQAFAKGLDTIGSKIKYGNPISRSFNSNFDNNVGGAVDEITQKGWAKHGQPAFDLGQKTARGDTYSVLEHLDPLISKGVHSEMDITNAARAAAEGVPNRFTNDLIQDVHPLSRNIDAIRTRQLEEARRQGLPLADLKDEYAGYVHRSATDIDHKGLQLGGRKRNLYPVVSGSNVGRDPMFRNVPGGTDRINSWFDRFAGLSSKPDVANTADVIRRELEDDLVRSGRAMDPTIAKAFDGKAIELAGRISVSNPKYRSVAATVDDPAVAGIPFFSPDLTGDMTQRSMQHARTMASGKAAIGTIADVARKYSNDGSMVSIPDLLHRIGLNTTKHDKVTGAPMQGALVEMYRALAPKGAGMVDPFLTKSMKSLRKTVGKYGLSNEHAEQILKAYQGWQAPEQIKSSIKGLDSFTNAFKSLAYPIWLPSHVRNASTAFLNNLRSGTKIHDYLDQLKIMTGRGGRDLKGISSVFDALPDAERLNAIRKSQFASSNIFGGNGMNDEIAGLKSVLQGNADRFTPNIPGSDRVGRFNHLGKDTADMIFNQGLLGSAKASGSAIKNAVKDPMAFAPRNWGSGRVSEALSPIAIKGVGGATRDALPLVSVGRKAGSNIEDFFRGALWNREVRTGATPEMASNQINKLHFDYDALAPFEKNVMRRVVPFYTFARRNIPLQIETALTHPGLIQAQSKPFNQTSEEQRGYIPNYLNSGVAIPTGPEVDGKRQYLSKLGLPAEEAFSQMHFRNGIPEVGRTLMDYMSMMNPVFKAPIEQLFDKQFHTQRNLSDLKAPRTVGAIGRIFGDENPQLLSQIAANSPFTRFISSADKIADPRKSIGQKLLNLGTGLRVTDVDVDRQRAIELRSELEEMMKGHPNISKHTKMYVRKGDADKLTPSEIEMMRMYSDLQNQARAYAESQKKIGIKK